MLLAEELMKGLADSVVEKGEGYQRARAAFGMLARQYGNAAFLAAQFVGGEHVLPRPQGRRQRPRSVVPVPAARQREALKFLQDRILTDKPFGFPPELLRKLAADRWLHWGNEHAFMGGVTFPLNDRILGIQRVCLSELLHDQTLARLQDQAAECDKGGCLTISEVMRALTESTFADLPNSADKAGTAKSSIIRRNLQRAYIAALSQQVLRGKVPDARSLARMHLRNVSKRIDLALKDKKSPLEDTVRAHLEETKELIAKALNASMTQQ